MIRVAIADDSAFTCRLLTSYVEDSGDCEVVAVAHDARSTVDAVRRTSPDVLTLDLAMPGAAGLDLLREVAGVVPVVVISGVTRGAAAITLRALDYGAVDFVLKYTPGMPVSPASLRREIVAKVKMAAASKRQHRSLAVQPMDVASIGSSTAARHKPAAARVRRERPPRVVVIGASTGGPKAVAELIERLPADFAVPCVIVQHLPPTFTGAFAEQLTRHSKLPVIEARAKARLEPGRTLVAPGGAHLLFGEDDRLELRTLARGDVYRPSIDATFTSAADRFGSDAIAVVLSGMGVDGAEGLRRVRERGGEGYVQDPASCIVASMPLRAIERAGADYVAAPARIGDRLAMRGRLS